VSKKRTEAKRFFRIKRESGSPTRFIWIFALNAEMTLLLWARFVLLVAMVAIAALYLWAELAERE
jgi:hypothetical protein